MYLINFISPYIEIKIEIKMDKAIMNINAYARLL